MIAQRTVDKVNIISNNKNILKKNAWKPKNTENESNVKLLEEQELQRNGC